MPDIVDTPSGNRAIDCGCCRCFFKKSQSDLYDIEVTKAADELSYVHDLQEPLIPGSCILIKGVIRPQCKRFTVNLLQVRGPKTEIVFHFNPRLALRYIVRNSRLNNTWGEEETTSVTKFHLDRNKSFDLQIVTTDHEFLVAIDGLHICAYIYRTSVDKINKIQVEGSVNIKELNIQQVSTYPLTSPENVNFVVPMDDDSIKGDSPKLVVPITASLPQGFKENYQLEITGRVKILPSAFYINLQEGNKLWPHPLIPLHLNPRFYTSYGNHLLVRNSWANGDWGFEERTAGFQFTPGKPFRLAIRRNADNFGVWIDGILAGEFQFRTPVDTIDTLYIHGDILISSILMKDHIDDKYFHSSREQLSQLQ